MCGFGFQLEEGFSEKVIEGKVGRGTQGVDPLQQGSVVFWR